ncbi:MAG: radical SAM protein [Bacilli bacterium]|nr:radical SAM protein [Bacilli bacterium]
MKKLYTQNLGLIVTERCNLNCQHCLRGKCSDKVMSDEVIESTLSQFCYISNLAICGGEPTLALDRIEKIFSYIIDNNIIVDTVTMTINGTNYSEDFLKILEHMQEYVNYKKLAKSLVTFDISWDKFHYAEIERLGFLPEYLENIKKYARSKFFLEFRKLSGKLFREGNAANLDEQDTVPLKPMNLFLSYPGKSILGGLFVTSNRESGLCNIGPLITVNVDGIITECDASIDNQRNLYNYGNVLSDSIEDVCLNRRKALVLKPKQWYKATGNKMKRYYYYD